jgi:hypothetical protein
METIKNFLTGLVVVVMSLLLLGLVLLTWPILIGIGSLVLSIVAAVLFVILLFYVVVLVGHLTRYIISKR